MRHSIKKTSYCLAAFLGAFLLFAVQPMASKALLPWFGGSYLVWGSCMVFYQGVLLAGYAYAHFIHKRLGAERYARWHLLLLVAPVVCFPFRFSQGFEKFESIPLVMAVFLILAMAVGLPFFVLSTTSLVLQKWLAASDLEDRKDPYFLYSVSNLGSLLALLGYPFLIEPLLNLTQQGYAWWGGYLLLVVLQVLCVPWKRSPAQYNETGVSEPGSGPGPAGTISVRDAAGWFLLSAGSCCVLLATTNVITFDVASAPLLWVLPLSIYLLTFVLAFKKKPWRPERLARIFPWLVIPAIAVHLMSQLRLTLPLWFFLSFYGLTLFAVCTVCNGRLAAGKPANLDHMTAYYLIIASGGFAGSLLVTWLAPAVSNTLMEYPLSFLAAFGGLAVCGTHVRVKGARFEWKDCAVAAVLAGIAAAVFTVVPWWVSRSFDLDVQKKCVMLFVLIGGTASVVMLAASRKPLRFAAVLLAVGVSMNWTEELAVGGASVRRLRNFYGIYKVYDMGNLRYLQHGTTQHGRQYRSGADKDTPLAYFHPTTPAAGVLNSDLFSFRNIGMIGLGTGALAAYTKEGQAFTIYELDADNGSIAEDCFTYLSIARRNGANLSFVFGDGRVSLKNEKTGSLDLFMVDAFNSGSIPIHLLTTEAFEEYFRVLKNDGILLLHISNRMLDLAPVVFSNARALGLYACEKTNMDNRHPDAEDTVWMAVCGDPAKADLLANGLGWVVRAGEPGMNVRPWTDQYCNVMGAMLR